MSLAAYSSERLHLVRTLIWFSLGGLVALWGVFAFTPRFAEPQMASAIVAAATICVVIGFVAMIPPALVAPRWPDYMVQAGMGAMVIRMLLTLGVGAIYLKVYAPLEQTFMTAMVICYLLLLAVETCVTMRLVKLHWQPQESA